MNVSIDSTFLQEFDPRGYYIDELKHQVNKLNKEPFNSKAVKLRTAVGNVNNIFKKKDLDLNSIAHVTVEHMSEGKLSSGQTLRAIPKIIKLLTKITPTDKVTKVINQLKYAFNIEKKINNSCKNLFKEIKDDIDGLSLGESVVLPSKSKRHSMMMSITCTSIEEKEKKFSVIQYNEGDGIRYHYSKGYPSLFQVALEITDICSDKIIGEKSSFIKDVLSKINIEKYYESVIPGLRGLVAPPSEDSRVWSFGQLGGSCSSACINAFIRVQLPTVSFSEYQTVAKTKYLLKLYRQIKKGCGNSSIKNLIALDIVKQLEEEDSTLNQDKKQFWSNIKKELQVKNTTSLKYNQSIEAPDKTRKFKLGEVNYNLEIAFNILNSLKFSEQSIKEASPFLEGSFNFLKILNITKNEFSEFIKIAIKIISYCKKPLNFEQIYFTTVLCCIINNVIYDSYVLSVDNLNNNEWVKERQKLRDFTYDIFHKCFVLSLDIKPDLQISDNFNRAISYWKKRYIKNYDLISPDMQKMMDNSRRAI